MLKKHFGSTSVVDIYDVLWMQLGEEQTLPSQHLPAQS